MLAGTGDVGQVEPSAPAPYPQGAVFQPFLNGQKPVFPVARETERNQELLEVLMWHDPLTRDPRRHVAIGPAQPLQLLAEARVHIPGANAPGGNIDAEAGRTSPRARVVRHVDAEVYDRLRQRVVIAPVPPALLRPRAAGGSATGLRTGKPQPGAEIILDELWITLGQGNASGSGVAKPVGGARRTFAVPPRASPF